MSRVPLPLSLHHPRPPRSVIRSSLRCSVRGVLLGALAVTMMPALTQAQAPARRDSAGTDSLRQRALGAMVVSATRTQQAVRTLPQHVSVLDASTIVEMPAQTAADLLRAVPGFTTRDFQSGMLLGPSQSIVSFRGLGGSSAGRTLMLLDDVPVGDPFSGWFDWGRLPLPLVESVEVVRGGGATIWGSRALGGVVNLRTITPAKSSASAMVEGGSFGTTHSAGAATLRSGRLTTTIAADAWNTSGTLLIREDQKGPVDRPVGRLSNVVVGKLTYDATPALRVWSSFSRFRGGERPYHTTDEDSVDDVRAGLRWVRRSGAIASLNAYAVQRGSLNVSTTLNTARTTETPARAFDAPADGLGLSAQYTQQLAPHQLTVGADVSTGMGRLVEDQNWTSNAFTRRRIMTGRQTIGGVFVQDGVELSPTLRLLASVRGDLVHDRSRRRTLYAIPAGAPLADTSYAAQTTSRITGSLGMRWQAHRAVAARLNAYEAFRAPSLYEQVYPRFSSRGAITESNPGATAEMLSGVETGFDVTAFRIATARVTAYYNRVRGALLDLTVGTAGAATTDIVPCGLTPARQTCAQRRNVEALVSQGVESEFEIAPQSFWRLTAGYSYTPTRVRAPGEPVNGKEAIRAPRHMASATVRLDLPRVAMLTVEGRHVARRYDNDLNTIVLRDFTLLNVRASRAVGSHVLLQGTVENALDRRFPIARTSGGLEDMGAPRWITFGVRTTW